MKIVLIILVAGSFMLPACVSDKEEKVLHENINTIDSINTQEMTVTIEMLKQVLDGFNRHDLDAIMTYFAEDCTFDLPRGPEYRGQRFVGKTQVRQGLATRFMGIPDVHYGDDHHWVSSDGKMGVSEWTLTGTTTFGVKLKVRGCDLWEFQDGKITRKDSYWKIVEPPSSQK